MSDSVLTNDILEAIAKLPPRKRKPVMRHFAQLEWQRCADDVFYWLDASAHFRSPRWPEGTPYVFTNDPHPMFECVICHDAETPHMFHKRRDHLDLFHQTSVKTEKELASYFRELPGTRPFPQGLLKEYMGPIIEAWLAKPFLCIEKSRDMMATWLAVTLYTWDTIFHKNRQNVFQSEDAPKTCELIRRAFFIYNNQPNFMKEVHKVHFRIGQSKSGELFVPTLESELLGFPQGADQIRQYHPTGLFSDEAAFQSAAGDTFSAVKPALQNGGRYTAVSSANPSYFMHLCRDTIHTL